MEPLSILYNHCSKTSKESPQLQQLWDEMRETIKREIPASYQNIFSDLVEHLVNESQYYGFALGVYTAVTLCKDSERIYNSSSSNHEYPISWEKTKSNT